MRGIDGDRIEKGGLQRDKCGWNREEWECRGRE